MPKLLLIDDDKEVLLVNKKYFIKEGYEVKAAINGTNGIKLLKEFQADCIILDVMMPDMDGFETCKRIKAITKAPIIFLTGRSFEDDKVKGLLMGAEDYIVKPFSLRELSARIQVQLRRVIQTSIDNAIIAYPPLLLNLGKHKAFYNEEEIPLSNREYELLHLLVSQANKTITFEDIGKIMWGTYSDSDRQDNGNCKPA